MKRDLAFEIKEYLHTVTEVVDAEKRLVKYVEGIDDATVGEKFGQTTGAVAGVRRQFIGGLISKKNGHFKEDVVQALTDRLMSIEDTLDIVKAIANKADGDIARLSKAIEAVKDAAERNATAVRAQKTVQDDLIRRIDKLSR